MLIAIYFHYMEKHMRDIFLFIIIIIFVVQKRKKGRVFEASVWGRLK